MQVKVNTTTGETTIETTHIAAITLRETSTPELMPRRAYRYLLDIHMTSGTIFNADLKEKEMRHLYWAWAGVYGPALPQEEE
tara:strand:- start:402 stop:647 length:246 start_codon:yes stop_codon:yes gene_type:complete